MKINVLSKDTTTNIFDLVTHINKTTNMTALVLPHKKDEYFVIRIESFENADINMTIDTDSVDSMESMYCTCSNCKTQFAMQCNAARKISHCPYCGNKVNIREI